MIVSLSRLQDAIRASVCLLGLALSSASAFAADPRTQEIYRFPVDVQGTSGTGGPAGLVIQRTPGAASPYALYGTLYSPEGQSYVFKLIPPPPGVEHGAWTQTVLYKTADSSTTIFSSVVLDGAGALYGVKNYLNYGTVFKLIPPTAPDTKWRLTTLPGDPDIRPFASLTLDASGAIYGTSYTSLSGCGLVFRLAPPLSPSGTYKFQVLHNFPYETDGYCASAPENRLVIDRFGDVYGTAPPVFFKLSPSRDASANWTYQVIYTNPLGVASGPLAIDPSGTLYASALTSTQSVIFTLTPPTSSRSAWIRKSIATLPFDARDPWEQSQARSLMYLNGDLIVTNLHSVFELTPPGAGDGLWTTKTLHTFNTANQVPALDAPFAVDAAGNIYGGVDCSSCDSTFGSAYKIYRTAASSAH